jgi:signal transduction histidine kinase
MAGEDQVAPTRAPGLAPAAHPRLHNDPVSSWAAILPSAAAIVAIAVGMLVLVGWALWIAPLMSMLPGLVPMNPISAVCFILGGVALHSVHSRCRFPWVRRFGWVGAGIIAVVGLIRLIEYGLGWHLHIDQLLFAEKLEHVAFAPNRMAPNTAMNFVLLGAGLLFWRSGHWAMRMLTTACAALTILSAFLASVGYANGVNSLYGIGSFIPMALHTAAAFLVLALGLLLTPVPARAVDEAVSTDQPSLLARHGSLEGKIKFGFGVALFMSLAVGISAFLSIAQFSRDSAWSEHSREVLMQIDDLDSNLSNAETQARGFVISGEEEYPQLFQTAVDVAHSNLDAMRKETMDNPNQQRRLADLGPFIEARLTNLRSTMQLRRERGFYEAGHTLLAREGKQIMDSVQSVLHQMRDEEEALQKTRSTALASSTRATFAVIVGGCALAFVLVGFAGAVIRRDMGARARAEQHVRELNQHLDRHAAQLEAANKELEAFSYAVSHDLRAPLRTIDGFSKAIIEDYGDKLDPDGHEHLQRVCGAADRMGRLIDDMLNLSRVTRSEMRHERLSLSDVARSVINELQSAQPERNAEVVIADRMSVEGDPRLLRVVLDNLIGNAWKFTSKTPQARIEVGAAMRDGQRAFYVRDNGAGFDMAFAHKLFGAFQRLHAMEEFSGTGIGLATVQRIARRHGGKVWAEGAVGRGATFYFTLGGAAV